MRRLIRLGTIALMVQPLAAWSQAPSGMIPGSRIRITEFGTGHGGRRAGTLVPAGADTVALMLDGSGVAMAIPLAGISNIEMSRGLKGNAAAGIGIGFLAGAGVGALAAVIAFGSEGYTSGSDTYPTGLVALVWAGIGGVVGMVPGGLIGAHSKTEKWEEVPPPRWHVSGRAARAGGLDLALQVRF